MRAVAKKFLKSLEENTEESQRFLRHVSASERYDSTVKIVVRYLQMCVPSELWLCYRLMAYNFLSMPQFYKF